MSNARRRPTTGGARRPQVAGRPRGTAAPATSDEPEETAEGGLAVETDRAAARTVPDAQETGRSGARPRTVARTRDAAPTAPAAPARKARRGRIADAPEPEAAEPDAAEKGDAATTKRSRPAADLPSAPPVRSGESSDDDGDDRDDDSGPDGDVSWTRRIPRPSAPTTRRGTAVLLAVTLLLTAAAVFFAVSWARLQFGGSATNTALTDVGTTAAVSEQINDAVTKVYSFDFARLDQAESDARADITGPFVGEFEKIFGNVRQLAPKQQAVVTATIPKSAVVSIDGDHATLYVFVNQVIRRVDDAGKPLQGGAAARLRVDAQYEDGRWKISGMTPA